MVKAIIFDLDGTLVDSSAFTLKRHELAARKLGLEPPEWGDFRKLSGNSWHNILKTIWPQVDPEEFIAVYLTTNVGKYPPVKGAVGAVKSLVGHYRLGVLTGTPGARGREKLVDAGFDLGWFEFVHGEEDLEFGKPDGRAFSKALEILSLDPKEIVYVGDTANDYASAKAAGINFIGVLTGYGIPEDFGGARFISSVTELPSALDDF